MILEGWVFLMSEVPCRVQDVGLMIVWMRGLDRRVQDSGFGFEGSGFRI